MRFDNAYFITGTAYAGKSTMVKLLAEKYNGILCEENYHDQLFELDTYPFSDSLAIMELEMESPEQLIDFPDNVRVIKDVSADKRYSNSALASAGRFPADKIGENN